MIWREKNMHCVSVSIVSLALALAPQAARAVPLISEVFYDAVGTDNGLLFVELYGDPGSGLDGLFLEGINGANGDAGPTIALSGFFPADGIFVLADDAGDGSTLVADADLIADFDFQNGPDSIVLRTATTTLDAVGYGVFDPGEVFAGEGTPAADAPAGSSLARRFADIDTGDNAVDFEIASLPTPGQAPLSSVPEPRTAALLGLGLLGLTWSGRKHRARAPR
jgi:hypothetical protein